MWGNLFREKGFPHTPSKKHSHKGLKNSVVSLRIDGRREDKPRFGYRDFVGATETLQNKKVVCNQKWNFVKNLAKCVFFCYNDLKQPMVE